MRKLYMVAESEEAKLLQTKINELIDNFERFSAGIEGINLRLSKLDKEMKRMQYFQRER